MQSLDSLLSSARQLSSRSSALVGRKTQLTLDLAQLEKNTSLAKSRLNLKDEVNEVLNLLQDQVHKKAVGKFEQCLTGILRDIFPGEDRIVIEVGIERQETSITISVTNGNHLEDVLDGRGGSIANVLSVGLRFISLKRSGLRPFIVLDEADCWLKPERIPAFAKVIGQLSKELGIQTLMISHHDHEFFRAYADIVYLQKAGNTVSATTLNDGLWEGDKKGVRSISLQNFQSHEKTVINLSPYFTVIVGDNDIGKSSIVTALKAVLEGSGKKSHIRHDKEEARVELDLGPEGLLCYSRTHAKSKNTRYALMKRGKSAINYEGGDDHDMGDEYTSEGSKLPYWIEKLGFGMPNGLDIQIGHQKKPVFLLDESGIKQAAVLSVGKESVYLGNMQKVYKGLLSDDSKTLKEGEKRAAHIKGRLEHLVDAEKHQAEIEQIQATLEILIKEQNDLLHMQSVIKALENNDRRQLEMRDVQLKLKALPDVVMPELKDLQSIRVLIEQRCKYDQVSRINPITKTVELPKLIDVKPLQDLLNNMIKAERAKAIKPVSLEVELPVLEDVLSLRQRAAQLREASQKERGYVDELKVIEEEYKVNQEQLSYFVDLLGGECPVCHGVLDGSHLHSEKQPFELDVA